MTSQPSSKGKRREPSSRTIFLTSAFALVAFIAVVLVARIAPGDAPLASTPAGESSSEGSVELELVRRLEGDPMALGDVDAPVVLIEWTDLRCPFCASFSRDTLPTLIEEYVDTGKVRVEFHDVAYFGAQSEDAAVAVRAAGNQNRFAEYLAAVFEAAPDGAHADLPRDALVEFAKVSGVPDIQRFTADLDDPALREASRRSTADAQQLGVSAVPFFVVGGTALSGAQPIDEFRSLLDSALEQTE